MFGTTQPGERWDDENNATAVLSGEGVALKYKDIIFLFILCLCITIHLTFWSFSFLLKVVAVLCFAFFMLILQ